MSDHTHGEGQNGNAVPAPRDTGGEVIRVRKGMFGANNGGDTSRNNFV